MLVVVLNSATIKLGRVTLAFGSRGIAFVFCFKNSDAGIEFNVTKFVDNKVKIYNI